MSVGLAIVFWLVRFSLRKAQVTSSGRCTIIGPRGPLNHFGVLEACAKGGQLCKIASVNRMIVVCTSSGRCTIIGLRKP